MALFLFLFFPDSFCMDMYGHDMNARMGKTTNDFVGDFGAEEETFASKCFFDFLSAHQLWLPATFDGTHRGQHATWYHPNGQSSRLDYIAIPQAWASWEVRNEVKDRLGIHHTLYDHQPVCLSVRGLSRCGEREEPWHLKKRGRLKVDLKDPENLWKLQQSLSQMPLHSWNLDIHRHVEYFHRAITQRAMKVSHRQSHVWKEHLSEETWEAIADKTTLRKKFFRLKKDLEISQTKVIWDSWRSGKCQESFPEKIKDICFELAITERDFRKQSIHTQGLVRRDDQTFLRSFVERFEHAANSNDVRNLWKELKRFLPKHKGKRGTGSVRQNESLKEQWAPHLCQMEAGRVIQADDLYWQCLNRQNENEGLCPKLAEVPSLLEIEWSLRESKTGKQGGPDGVEPEWIRALAKELALPIWRIALKQSLWGVEAIQFKGGSLAMIPKPGGSRSEASGFRGILLSSEIGKRLQALARRELIGNIEPAKPVLQIGGFRNQEPAFGAHYVRTFVACCSEKKISSSIIFIDLRAAYHSLIRQFLTGRCRGDDEDIEVLRTCLQKEGIDGDEIIANLEHCSILEELKVEPGFLERMKEFNMDTWSNIFGAGCLVKTARGSRPGSPLADAQFSSLMSEIGHYVTASLQDVPEIQTACEKTGLAPSAVIWADDLAIVYPICDTDKVLPITGNIMEGTQKHFASKGLSVNFKKGKSEAVVTLCGHGSREIRKQLLQQPFIFFSDEVKQPLRIEGKYRHLGTFQQCGGGLDQEIAYRIAMTWSSFRQIRRLLGRHSTDLQVRLRLMQSLLMSRLLYGAGAWKPLSKRHMKKLHGCYVGILRFIVGRTQTRKQIHHEWTDQRILADYKLPCIRTLLATARLTYARRVWCNGGQKMQDILIKEGNSNSISWMQGLLEDLNWLYAVQGTAWGGDFEATSNMWLQQKRGWKSFVKSAQQRHVLQEALAFQFNKKRGLCSNTGSGTQWEDDGWLCGCGAWFETKRALQVHKHTKHEIYSSIYEMVSGTICPACLLQLWTPQRLQMHLRYRPRRKKLNRCFNLIAAWRMKRENEPEEVELPMKGIQRRDAIPCAGPKRFGVDDADEAFARCRISQIENMLEQRGISEVVELIDETISSDIHFVLERWETSWKEELEELRHMNGNSIKFSVNLLFCGGKFQWQRREDQALWRAYLEHCHMGPDLCEWFDLRLRLAFLVNALTLDLEENLEKERDEPTKKSFEDSGWTRSIARINDVGGLYGDLHELRKPRASCRLILRALKQCS